MIGVFAPVFELLALILSGNVTDKSILKMGSNMSKVSKLGNK